MNKRLVMWGTFLVVFLISIVSSYKFINRNNQDLTMDMSAPTLPLVSITMEDISMNTLHGYTAEMESTFVAEYVVPVSENRVLSGQVDTFGANVSGMEFEVRNNDGTRLIESDEIVWEKKSLDKLEFSIKFKDLIVSGEEYLFILKMKTDTHSEINYYTRFAYGKEFDWQNQLAFIQQFHEASFDKNRTEEISRYLETDRSVENINLGHVTITSMARQVQWDQLPVERITQPEVSITYLQDNYGAYTLDYYIQSVVEQDIQNYHVVEKFLVSTYGDQIYLLDYDRTAEAQYNCEGDVYQNDKINLYIQHEDVQVEESDDGNMAAFVVNNSLYYYNDIENEITYVYGFTDELNSDARSLYPEHDIKILQVNESGSIYFVVYGYMNRGIHEGKTGIALYLYNGQTKLVEEKGFYQSTKSMEYIRQEINTLSFLSRQGIFYFYQDGNIVAFDVEYGQSEVVIPYQRNEEIFVADNHSSIVEIMDGYVLFWNLENGIRREIRTEDGGEIIPLGFIGSDFVYGIFYEEDRILQSDGTSARYMRTVCIQNIQGEIRKQYSADGYLVSGCTIRDNQIILDRIQVKNGRVYGASQEQIIASEIANQKQNFISTALTSTYQTISQIELKRKMDIDKLAFRHAKESFYEGSKYITVEIVARKEYYSVLSPWERVCYVETPGEAVLLADQLDGIARDPSGLIVWKKAETVIKNQIMDIELENTSPLRTSKNICMDIMVREIGNPRDTLSEIQEGKSCQEILADVPQEYKSMDITGCSLEAMLYYTNQDIPIMVLFEDGNALLITGFNQFNIVVMDPAARKLGYVSRSDAKEMLQETNNQIFTYYHQKKN